MDNCMTCKDQKCCPMYDEYGVITGCYEWRPTGSLVAEDEKEHVESCVNCGIYKKCTVHKHSIYGCQLWEPIKDHELDIRRSLDEGRPAEQGEVETDGLNAAKGILLALVISLAIWAIIWALIVLF